MFMKTVLLLLVLISNFVFAQQPVVYSLQWHQYRTGEEVHHFVSVSDRYWLKEHPDSLAIPDQYLGNRTEPAETYFKLTGEYRDRCLKATDISENDIVYVYDYKKDILLRFYVKGLNLIAVLNHYTGVNENPISQYDYRIGFEINPKYLNRFSKYYPHVLVSIGRSNPFTRGKMKPMTWTKTEISLFPSDTKLIKEDQWLANSTAGDTYYFKMDNLTYFAQNIMVDAGFAARHLAVIDSQSKALLFEQVYAGSEGGDPTPLNNIHPEYNIYLNQFAGQLFRNNPPVVLGFMYRSFGCTGIEFVTGNKERVYIHCDNRH